jgi:ERCC4-related helicase
MIKHVPNIKPVSTTEYNLKQSKYEYAGKLPQRRLIVAPSGNGKTVLIQNLILDIYRNCFEKIYIFSPSIFIDDAFKRIIQYCKNELNQIEDDEH